MIQRYFKLFLNAGGDVLPPVIHVNQHDSGEQWIFTLYDENGVKYTPASGAIVGVKSDNLAILNSGSVDAQGRVVINETAQMTAAAGKAVFELLIDSGTHGTANFTVMVEARPGDNANVSDSDLSLLQQAIDGVADLFDITDEDVIEVINEAVEDYLTAHPEAINTIADGSVTMAKLSTEVRTKLGEIGSLANGLLIENDLLYLTHDGTIISNGVAIATGGGSSGGLAFDSGYQDEEGYIHLTKNGEDLDTDDFTPFLVAGGGGGGDTGSRLTFAVYTPTSFSVLESSGTAVITYKFTSIDSATQTATGAGNLAVYVGSTLKANLTVQQGDNLTIDVFSYLTSGSNVVRLVLTDAYGTSATRKFTIQKESFSLEWNLSDVNRNTGSDFSFYITPYGTGSKVIYTYVDGTLNSTDTVTTSGRRFTKTITGLSHGAHSIEVYGTMEVNGSTVESNHLHAAIAQITSSTGAPVIAVNWPSGNLEQYTTVQIGYMVVNPAANPATVQLLVDGVIQSQADIDQSMHTWSYRPVVAGSHTLAIRCGSTTVSQSVTVTSIGGGAEEVTSGLTVKVDPSTMGSLRGWTDHGYYFTLSDNFDEVNGGLITDSEGVRCIRITAGDRMTLNYLPFAGDARRDGMALKIIYAIKDSTSKEAEGISCMNGGIGLSIKANNVYLYGNQTTVSLSTCEDQKAELDINIQQDSEDSLAYIWESASTFSYDQYAVNESYTQGTPKGITFGCDDADVYLYLLRGYNRDLTENEIKANFIADGKDGAEIIARLERNDIYNGSGGIDLEEAYSKNPDAHFIVINAPRMTLGKKDTVTGTIEHTYVSGGSQHKWSADMSMVVQGTSSVEHAATAGPNINFTLPNGITLEDGTVISEGYAMNGSSNSIPTNLLCWKKNIASQDHIINRACAEWYNRYQPSIRPARANDSRVRDCLESAMCVVFFHNTSDQIVQVGPDQVSPNETVFFGLGNLCSNKDAVEVFDYDNIVIEVKNNANDQVRFKSDDLSGDNWGSNYEFRYLNEDVYTEAQAIAEWQTVQTFIYETDWTAASNRALTPSRTINGQVFTVDSPAYRKARWIAEAPNIFDMDTLYFHHNFTLFYLLRDNRAKNMFWSKSKTTGLWGLWFNWDNDTGLCRNNDGYVDIEPGYMDFDPLGTGYVYNAADNALFTNLRECNFAELTANYLSRESAGAWNIDAFYAYCKASQEAICESLWIEDAEHNAIRTMQNLGTTAYLQRATGRLRLHILKALTFQKVLIDSYYVATAATSESTAFRGYNPDTWAGVQPSGVLSITTYTNMYINILAGSNSYRVRATAGTPVSVDISASLNNTEIYFRHAPWIQDFGDMSGLYLGQFEASNLKRVRRLLIGSPVAGYYNTNFTQATFTNCKRLSELNLGGLVNAARAFDFSPNIYLQTLYTKGSGITGITFAKNGRLRSIEINGVASLDMRGLRQLETFSMESMASLTALVIEDCPLIDTYAIVSAAVNIARVRLLNIDWSVTIAAYKTLMRLYNAQGIDDDGYSTAHGVVTGAVYFDAISQTKYNTLVSSLTDVTFTYGSILSEHTVTFKNEDGTVLYVTSIEHGGTVEDPVEEGLISAPTKDPDVDYVYTFYKWDLSLENITEDCDRVATFTRVTRYNTVTFVDWDGTVLETHSLVQAHSSISYGGSDLTRSGYVWQGWDQDTSDVISDMTVTAVYFYPTLPATIKDTTQYDFIYSDDPDDSMAYTAGEFYSIMRMGMTADYIPIGSKCKMVNTWSSIKDEYIIFQLHAIGHYELVSGGMSNADWYMIGVLNANRSVNSSNTNVGGWDSAVLRTWLNGSLYPHLPVFWRNLIQQSVTLANAGNQSSTITASNDYLRIPSFMEVGFGTGTVPYNGEVSSEAKEKAFSYYTSSNSRIKKTFNNTGTAQNWWLRSADAGSSSSFRAVATNGASGSYAASNSYGVCVGFSV